MRLTLFVIAIILAVALVADSAVLADIGLGFGGLALLAAFIFWSDAFTFTRKD